MQFLANDIEFGATVLLVPVRSTVPPSAWAIALESVVDAEHRNAEIEHGGVRQAPSAYTLDGRRTGRSPAGPWP